MQKYITSNLILESSCLKKFTESQKSSIENSEQTFYGSIKVCRTTLPSQNGDSTEYVTIFTPKLWLLDKSDSRKVSTVISDELGKMLRKICKNPSNVLVAGLGNRRLSADSLGALTADKISVTRHINLVNSEAFNSLDTCSVSAVSCGVLGDTGVESAEILKGLVSEICPQVIIAVDALAARAVERLGATVQISDVGISPGAGIGNRRHALNKKNLGVPVIALGVPTVISASTLVADTLDKIGIAANDELERLLTERKNFFVTSKESDLLSVGASEVLADAINRTLIGI